MKNTRLKGAIVILIVVLLLPSCKGKAEAQTSGGGRSVNSADDLKKYLDSQPANGPDKPIRVAMKANDAMIENIAKAIKEAGKYVSLDLSGSPLTTIPSSAFERTSLTSIIIPNSVTRIGSIAFYECTSLTSVTIPDSVTSIGNQAFEGCTSLTSVTIPNSVTSIGDRAFAKSGLTSVTIGNKVTSIGDTAFWDCTGLTSITVASGNPNYSIQGGILYNKAKTEIIFVPRGISGSVTIPNGVTSIGKNTFYECTSLTSITIPNSVTSIGDAAFAGCTSLTGITIPNSVTSIGGSAFGGCTSLTSVTIPNSITRILSYAFNYCTSLTRITIPNSVTSIGDMAFSDCTSLTSVTFEGTISSRGFSYECLPGNLETVYLAGGPGTYTTTAPVGARSVWIKQ